MVISNWRFGTTSRSHPRGIKNPSPSPKMEFFAHEDDFGGGDSWPLRMEPIGFPGTSVWNYRYSLCINPEDCIFHVWWLTINVKWYRYRPGVAQRVGRSIALLFHDRVTRRGWVVSSTPRPHFTPRKDAVPILQEAGWTPGPVWTGGKSRPHRDSIPDRPARSSVAIPTKLPGPQTINAENTN